MTARVHPLFVRETKAASMLDMRPAEFRELVEAGALPGPENISGRLRWRVATLEAIGTGAALEEDFEP
ncbi:MAG: hypothetical protein K8F31_08150 [Roseovarius sp.]|nr:hypothetical protein [Roseovarius sp.]